MSRGIYRKVPGVGRSSNAVLSTRHRLWLAPDHLLSVCNQGYSEDYKRFYLRDIQAVIIKPTRRGRVINLILGGFASALSILTLYGLLERWDPVGIGVAAGHAMAFLLGLLVNTALGPTCVCTLRTAVQTERLYSLVRVRTALRALKLIREAVEAVQGTLTPDEIDRQAAQITADGAVTVAHAPMAAPLTAVGVKPYRSWAHAALFSTLLVDMYHSALQFVWQSTVMMVLSSLILVALVGTLILAVIRQADTDLPRGLKVTTWWAMGYLIVWYSVSSVAFGILLGVQRAPSSTPVDGWDLARSMWTTSPFESVPILVMVLVSLICSGVLGIVGWTQLRAFYRRRAQSAPPVDIPPLPTPPPL